MQISFTNPYNRAWLRMKSALFGPLDLGKWFALGFTAWLAQLGTGPGFNFNLDAGDWGENSAFRDLSGDDFSWTDPSNFPIPDWSVPLLIILAVGSLLIGLLMLWLSSRGKFMFLDNLVHDRSEIARPWREQAALGDSAFLWQVLFTIVTMVVFGTLIAALIVGTALPGLLNAPSAGMVILAILAGTILFMVSMVALYTQFFMNRFVIPLMYRDRIGVMEGWRQFLALFGQDPISFVLYGIFYLVALVVGWLLFLFMGLITCCVGLLMISIPYIGTVVTLPLPVVLRYMDLEFLAQFEGGGGLLSPLPRAKVPSPALANPAGVASDQVDSEGTVIRPEDVGPDAGSPQAGPQDP